MTKTASKRGPAARTQRFTTTPTRAATTQAAVDPASGGSGRSGVTTVVPRGGRFAYRKDGRLYVSFGGTAHSVPANDPGRFQLTTVLDVDADEADALVKLFPDPTVSDVCRYVDVATPDAMLRVANAREVA